MKTSSSSRFRFLTMSFVALVIASFVSNSFAGSINFTKITYKNGDSRIIRCADGACSIDDLKPGDFTISIVDENGKPVTSSKFSVTATVTAPRDVASGMPTGKMATTDGQLTAHEVTSPRDPASGLPTGKRMHKPMTFKKELDKASPILACSTPDDPTVMKWTLEIRFERIEMK